jgi:hypothetical protein
MGASGAGAEAEAEAVRVREVGLALVWAGDLPTLVLAPPLRDPRTSSELAFPAGPATASESSLASVSAPASSRHACSGMVTSAGDRFEGARGGLAGLEAAEGRPWPGEGAGEGVKLEEEPGAGASAITALALAGPACLAPRSVPRAAPGTGALAVSEVEAAAF